MFTKSSRISLPIAKRDLSATTTRNANRIFTTVLIPHSNEHLERQAELFRSAGIAAKLTYLPMNSELIGLNITLPKPHLLGTAPVFNPGILSALSDREKLEWLKLSEDYYAQVGRYRLLRDARCLTSLSDNGELVHYITHGILEPQGETYTPVEKMIDLTGIEKSKNDGRPTS